MKKYWLVLYPDSFLWMKNGNGIIYNSKNFKHFTFCLADDINKLCYTLIDMDSLYSAELSETMFCDKQIKRWVDKITNIGAGELIEQNGKKKKLISYYPLLTIQKNVDNILWKDGLSLGGEIVKNLDELIFYLNGSPNGSEQFFKQIYYPLQSTKSLDFEPVDSLVKKCDNGQLKQITFIGDLFNYKDFDKLQKWILNSDLSIHLVLSAEDIDEIYLIGIEKFDSERISISIVAKNYSTFQNKYDWIKNFSNKLNWEFLVTSIDQFELIRSIIEEKNLINFKIIPIFSRNNKEFFEENVYLTIEEFNDIALSRREVFMNMTINSHNFGKLTIMPNKKVYANVNEAPLGNIETPIYDIIFKEMTEGYSWFRVRDAEPCCNCVYQWLCPSPSNYEQVIGKPNLCHVIT